MISKIYWSYKTASGGRLGTMPRPRGGDWLEQEIKGMKIQGVDILVSMLENREERELKLQKEKTYCKLFGITFVNHPVEDLTCPTSLKSFGDLAERLQKKVEDGARVAIHCRMGIGRATIMAVGVLLVAGIKTAEALKMVELARGIQVPDTIEQIAWLENFEDWLKRKKS